jgi:hypothetical protein
MSIRITCINKAGGNHEDPHLAISTLGWINNETGQTGQSSRIDVYNWLTQGGVAYTQDSKGIAYLIPKTSRFGNPFVQTQTDGRTTDNLLRLPECQ